MFNKSVKRNSSPKQWGMIGILVFLLIFLGFMVYVKVSLNNQAKKMDNLTNTIITNTNQVQGITNFINSSLSQAQAQQ